MSNESGRVDGDFERLAHLLTGHDECLGPLRHYVIWPNGAAVTFKFNAHLELLDPAGWFCVGIYAAV